MKVLALERELQETSVAQAQLYLKPEAAKVWELYQSGIIREVYFDADHHTAMLVLECPDAAHARQILATLPLVKAGMVTFDVIPLIPYAGFSRLFATK